APPRPPSHLPKIYQALLVSATFNPDVEALKELVLHNPVIVQPQEPRLPGSAQLQQWVVRCDTEEDKFLLLCALLKLALLRGRALLFVGALPRCYRLKLFLEQFGIAACALNSELPARSRCHVITQFNRGLYDYIVATDEEALEAPAGQPPQKKRKGAADSKGKDPEYSVSRGIDFQNVAAVINFDVPPTVESYIHRVGRERRVHAAALQVLHGGDRGPAVPLPGRHALRHQAGGEGGSAAGDQGGAAQLREAQDVLRGQPPRPARPAPRQAAAPRHRQTSPPQRARLPGATQPPQHRQAQPEEAQAATAVPRRCRPPRRPHGECGTAVTPPGHRGYPPVPWFSGSDAAFLCPYRHAATPTHCRASSTPASAPSAVPRSPPEPPLPPRGLCPGPPQP
uniref:RNA helicase n=1 Tax=Anas platyrhynchos platyrhynchos TaxID=8840 RepID=A0A493U1R6_ANAPP